MLKQTLTQRSLKLGGAGSGVVYQLHRTALNAAALNEAAVVLWQKIRHLNPTHLAAPGLGAAPIAAAIGQVALAHGLVLETLAVRDPAKSRAGERLVEGFAPPPAGQAVRMVFVDDTITHGSTYRATQKAVAESGIAAQWVACALLIDAWHPHGSRQIDAAGVPVYSALRRHDVGLTRDALQPMPAPFDLAAPLWVRHGLVSKPEHPRKAIPVIYQKSVIIALDDCSIRSYDLITGYEIWVLEAINPRSKGCGNDLTVQPDGFILLGSYDGTVTKLCAATGQVAWSRLLAMAIHSAPSVDGNCVYVSTEDRNQGAAAGRVVCLDYMTGAMHWQTQLGELSPTQTACTYGYVAAAANNCMAFLLCAWTGAIRWQVKLPALARGRPVYAYGTVIFACENGEVIAFSTDDGSVAWHNRASCGFDHSSPLLIDGCVVLVDGSMHLLALCARTGVLKWVNRLRGKAAWRPTVVGKHLITWTADGHVAMHDPATQTKVWETKAKGKRVFIGSTPAAAGSSHIAKLCGDGRLAVFKLNASTSL
jgi:outer membrane protein assembly factor BamB/orotate phosphoribosyltransferase